MAGLVGVPARKRAGCPVPAIHVLLSGKAGKTWMPATSADMTAARVGKFINTGGGARDLTLQRIGAKAVGPAGAV
jgi:hypothetical protein